MEKCTCEMMKRLSEIDARNNLMEFLMGLNEEYELVRNQILVIDPMPLVNKVVSMVERVEKQKRITGTLPNQTDSNVLNVSNWKKDSNAQDWKKDSRKSKKEDRQCDYYGNKGHTKGYCYKHHGYPEKGKSSDKGCGLKGKQYGKSSANAADVQKQDGFETPFDDANIGAKVDNALVNAVCQES